MLHINKHYIEEIFFKFLKLYFINNNSLLTIGSGRSLHCFCFTGDLYREIVVAFFLLMLYICPL